MSSPGAGGDYLLCFVTTSCEVCQPVWQLLTEVAQRPDLGAALVVVTPSPSMEDAARASALTPPGVYLHMGSATWFDYGVAQAGTWVLARATEGAPPPWEAPAQVRGARSGVTSLSQLMDVLARWRQTSP